MSGANARAIIRRRFPALSDRFEAVDRRSASQSFIESKKRARDWSSLLDRWLEGLEFASRSVIALSGFGDGSPARALLEKLPQGCFVFCVEKDIDSFRSVAEANATLQLLEDPRFLIGLGELDRDCFESLSRLPLLEIEDVKPLAFAPIYNEAPEFYAAFFSEFAKNLDYWRKLFGTNVTAAGRWQSNTLANASRLISAPDIGVLESAFAGCSLMVVSAGPSLDESLDFVRSQRDKCLIVAVNSSYRALRNAGIIPHFVLAADPYEFTDRGFEGVSSEGSILICPFIVYPSVVERFRGRIFTWSQNHLLASYLRLKAGNTLGTFILEMGTVSACAFDVAKLFGCTRVVFVGQDLAAKSDGQLHASDSFYADLGVNEISEEQCRMMPGNTIAEVPVEEKLFVYLKTFVQLASERAGDFELINTSRLGARIEGIPYVSLEEMSTRFEEGSPSSWKEGWERAARILEGSSDSTGKLQLTLDEMRRYLDKVCALAVKSAYMLETALPESEAIASRLATEAEENRQQLEVMLEGDSNLFQVVHDGALKYELALYARAKTRLASIEEVAQRELEDCLEYFWAVAEGCFTLASEIRSEVARVGAD
ncbi:MAG: hypothetical protein CBD18_06355 [Opitutales bacterium TMED158]|nr:MAG: hypothetical protein CBD18_06355 [Opitutales bacterium TMED158]